MSHHQPRPACIAAHIGHLQIFSRYARQIGQGVRVLVQVPVRYSRSLVAAAQMGMRAGAPTTIAARWQSSWHESPHVDTS